jgi:hypothetical protein
LPVRNGGGSAQETAKAAALRPSPWLLSHKLIAAPAASISQAANPGKCHAGQTWHLADRYGLMGHDGLDSQVR